MDNVSVLLGISLIAMIIIVVIHSLNVSSGR